MWWLHKTSFIAIKHHFGVLNRVITINWSKQLSRVMSQCSSKNRKCFFFSTPFPEMSRGPPALISTYAEFTPPHACWSLVVHHYYLT